MSIARDAFSVTFDLDRVGLDGFHYEPTWTRGHPLEAARGPSLVRLKLVIPLGMEFPIYFVAGYIDGDAQLDVTLSSQVAEELAGRLTRPVISVVWNSGLWEQRANDSD